MVCGKCKSSPSCKREKTDGIEQDASIVAECMASLVNNCIQMIFVAGCSMNESLIEPGVILISRMI